MNHNTVILTNDYFDNSIPGARRINYIAKMLIDNMISVTIICKTINSNFDKIPEVNYIQFTNGKKDTFLQKIYSILADRKEIKKHLNEICKVKPIDSFIVGTIRLHQLRPVNIFMKKRNVKNRIFDVVEWYSFTQFKKLFISYDYIEKCILNSLCISKNDKVIAISSYLENYYKKRGVSTIVIPPTTDKFKENDSLAHKRNFNELIYAGSYGKKDNLKKIISAFKLLNQKRPSHQLKLYIYLDNYNVSLKKLADYNLYISNKISHKKLMKKLETVGFTIFVRNPNKRYTKAGFPSKFVESISRGLIPVTNFSSDISHYMKDMENGILIEKNNQTSILNSFYKILETDEKELIKISQKSFITSSMFSYDKFRIILKDLLFDETTN